MPYPLTTVKACEAVGLHRQRFNEMVSEGLYPAAPKTVPGRGRLFNETDMIALYIFTRLPEVGIHLDHAGLWVQSVIDGIIKFRNRDTVTIAVLDRSNGLVSVSIDDRLITKPTCSGIPILYSLTFHLPYIRSVLRERVEMINSVRIIIGGETMVP